MLIFNGKLVRPGGDLYDVQLPGLDWQVRDLTGKPMTSDYRGPGADHGHRIVLGSGQQATLFEYLVDPYPTQESVDFQEGFKARLRQLRASFPKNRSEKFQWGWQAADRELKNESDQAREKRLREIRADRRFKEIR